MNEWMNLIPVITRTSITRTKLIIGDKMRDRTDSPQTRDGDQRSQMERIKQLSYHNRRWWHYGISTMVLYLIRSLHYTVTKDQWLRHRVKGERLSNCPSSYAHTEDKCTEIGQVGTYPPKLYNNKNLVKYC